MTHQVHTRPALARMRGGERVLAKTFLLFDHSQGTRPVLSSSKSNSIHLPTLLPTPPLPPPPSPPLHTQSCDIPLFSLSFMTQASGLEKNNNNKLQQHLSPVPLPTELSPTTHAHPALLFPLPPNSQHPPTTPPPQFSHPLWVHCLWRSSVPEAVTNPTPQASRCTLSLNARIGEFLER